MLPTSAIDRATTAAPHRAFTVLRNERGQWVARESHGLIEGVFRSQRDAIRFALSEIGDAPSLIIQGDGDATARH